MDVTSLTQRVTEDDWETWRGIRLRSLRDSPDAFASTYEREAAYDEADWRERLRLGPRLLVVEGGEPVALGGGFPLPHGLAVFGLWTEPAHRGRGHATAILDVVVAWARKRDLRVELHVNLPTRARGRPTSATASRRRASSSRSGPAPTSRSS